MRCSEHDNIVRYPEFSNIVRYSICDIFLRCIVLQNCEIFCEIRSDGTMLDILSGLFGRIL